MKIWNLIRKTIVLAIAILCLSLSFVSPSYASELSGNWQLVSIDGAPLEVDSEVTAEIEDEQVSGSASCNHYFSSLRTNADSIRISSPMTTRMYCEFINQEARYLSALESAESYQVANGTLTIKGDDHVLKYKLK